MEWFIYAFAGAFFDATYFFFLKKFVKDINQYVLASGIFLSSFILLFLISLLKGFPAIGPQFISSVLITGLLNIIAVILYYKALKITDLSLSIPMISFTPVFLIFTSFIFLREFPTVFGILGILLVVVGSYLLHAAGNRNSLLHPFREMFRNKGVFYMLIVAFLFSLSSNFDKIAVLNSDPIFSSSMIFLFLGISFSILSIAKTNNLKMVYAKNVKVFFLIGLVLALEAIAINIAFTSSIVPYVIPVKRLSILLSVLYGGLLLKEKFVFPRALAAAIMVAGAVIIILFS